MAHPRKCEVGPKMICALPGAKDKRMHVMGPARHDGVPRMAVNRSTVRVIGGLAIAGSAL